MKWLLVILLVPSVLIGCQHWDFNATEGPTQSFNSFAKVEVRPFTIQASEANELVRLKELELAASVTHELTEWLRDTKLFSGSGRTLVIQGKVLGFDEGDRALRWVVGMGAGKGRLLAEVSLLDERGAVIAKGTALGTVTEGVFGGDMTGAARYLAKGIMLFIQQNHEAIQARK